MVGKKIVLLLIFATCIVYVPTKVSAVPRLVKVPFAVVKGAMAAGCLITASACVRACLETKLKLPTLTIDSPELAAQHDMRSKLIYWATGILSNVGQTFARTAEFAIQKTATISSGVVVGALGVYLAFSCMRTLVR